MSVGGKVVEVIDTGDRVWIDTNDRSGGSRRNLCAIYVERSDEALCVSPGDIVWWQGKLAFWTPRNAHGKNVGPVEVPLKRIGCSGVNRPLLTRDLDQLTKPRDVREARRAETDGK